MGESKVIVVPLMWVIIFSSEVVRSHLWVASRSLGCIEPATSRVRFVRILTTAQIVEALGGIVLLPRDAIIRRRPDLGRASDPYVRLPTRIGQLVEQDRLPHRKAGGAGDLHRICALRRVSSEVVEYTQLLCCVRSYDDEGARITAAVAVASGAERFSRWSAG